jgi:GTP-binding protein
VVGRPNVGKSTLYNRLLGRRRAITDAQPGVTRDVVESEWSCAGIPVRLCDTGGVTAERGVFSKLVSERALETVRSAAVIVFLMDVTEVTGEDEEYIEALRPYADRVVLAVNKADNEKREQAAYAFYEYGFQTVIPISAEHGINIEALTDAIAEHLRELGPEHLLEAGEEEQAADEPPAVLRLAIMGKPNTGKSTLANVLTDSENSLVSEIPGTTRDVVEGQLRFQDTEIRVLDTAGMRRKSKVEEDVEYYSVNRAVHTLDECDCAFLVVDANEGLSDQDKKIAQLAVDRGRGIVIVLNKWDTMPDISNIFNAVEDRVRFMFPVLQFAPIIAVSSTERTGIGRLLRTTVKIWKQLNRRIETGRLNRALEEWTEETPPPMIKGRRLKLRYITQPQSNPVRFVLFVSRKHAFPDTYLSYIRNKIRSEFGFTDIPIKIELRSSSEG